MPAGAQAGARAEGETTPLGEPGARRDEAREDGERERRDEDVAVEAVEDAAVAREEVAKVLDLAVALEHGRSEVADERDERDEDAVPSPVSTLTSRFTPKTSDFARDFAQTLRSRVEMSAGQRISPNNANLSEIGSCKDTF